MADQTPARFRTAGLSHRRPTAFRWAPSPEEAAALVTELGLIGLTALRLEGEIRPEGAHDFRLEGRLVAEAVQACVVTLAPVPARIDEPVVRRYLADYVDPDAEEVEVPEDDSAEAMPGEIILRDVAAEALALALPPYPRAPGATLGEAVFAAPGVAPMRDADLNPFAALARLQPGSGDKGE